MWLTNDEFAALASGTGSTELPPGTIANCLQSAINFIRRHTGDVIVAEVEAAADDSTVSKVTDLREAQELLARRKLLQTARKIREGGMPIQERDENAVTMNQYSTPQQVEIERAALLRDAMELIGVYSSQESDVGDYGRTVEFSHPEISDSCCESNYRVPVY